MAFAKYLQIYDGMTRVVCGVVEIPALRTANVITEFFAANGQWAKENRFGTCFFALSTHTIFLV